MKKFTYVFLALILLASNLSCTKSELCENRALCDIFTKTIIPAAGILLGVDLTVVSVAANAALNSIDCTDDAAMSESDFDVEFRLDANSTWQVIQSVSDQKLPIGQIKPDKEIQTNLNMVFNQPGQYRFKTLGDHDNRVVERDETNNLGCSGCLADPSKSNNISYSDILTVYENPDIPYDPTKPMVEIIRISKGE